jgi:hypothetical protein
VSLPRVTVEDDLVRVRMGFGFRATFPRSAVTSAVRDERRFVSIGAHGWNGRWLVNGWWGPYVRIELSPVQRAHLLGIPLRLRELLVSTPDPDALIGALT